MGESVQVVLRVRPTKRAGLPCVTTTSPKECVTHSKTGDKPFTFDTIFDKDCSQTHVYQQLGQTTVSGILKGYNHTILAYGQTGSGKTHTIFGPEGGNPASLRPGAAAFGERGLVPRILDELFQALQKLPPAETSWKVFMSGFELYQENVHDTLAPHPLPPSDYRIREDTVSGKGVYIEKLCIVEVVNLKDALEVVHKCMSSRKTASTLANETSSRSHSLITVTVEQVSHVQEGAQIQSRLNLVDLAGSEKVDKTGAEGERLKEAQKINLSLTLLGNVIYKLTDGKSIHIPYRDSKLTRILQDSLGGNARTTLLCCVSSSSSDESETLSTLHFASRAKYIKNQPVINKEYTLNELNILYSKAKDEIKWLKERLSLLDGGNTAAKVHHNGHELKPCLGDQSTPAPLFNNDTADEVKDLKNSVQSLLSELKDTKMELYEKIQEINDLKQQLEFYKKKQDSIQCEMNRNNALIEQHKQTVNVWKGKYQQLAVNAQSRGISTNTTQLVSSVSSSPSKPSTGTNRPTSRRLSATAKTGIHSKAPSSLSARKQGGSFRHSPTSSHVPDPAFEASVPVEPTALTGTITAEPLQSSSPTSLPTSTSSPTPTNGRTTAFLEAELSKYKEAEIQFMIKDANTSTTISDLQNEITKLNLNVKEEEKLLNN